MQNTDFNLKHALLSLSVSLFVSMLGLGIVGPLMSIYAESLGATGIWLGAIFSGFHLSRAFIMPLIGRLSDVLGRRKLFLILGMLCYGLTSIGYVLATTVPHLILARFLQGFGSGIVLPITMAYVGDITPPGKEGTYMGTINFARFMGWGCGPLIGGTLMDTYGIHVPFWIMTGLSFASLLLILGALPEYPRSHITRQNVSYRRILRNKAIRSVVIYRMINAIGTGNLFSFLPLLAVSLGISSTEVGILLSSRIIILSLLQGPFGTLADRYNKIRLIFISAVGSAILLLSVPFARNFPELFMIGLLIGCDWAVLMPATTALAAEVGRELGMASVMSTVNFGMSMGMVIGPLTSGLIMDFFGVRAIFYFGGLVAVFGAVLFYLLVR